MVSWPSKWSIWRQDNTVCTNNRLYGKLLYPSCFFSMKWKYWEKILSPWKMSETDVVELSVIKFIYLFVCLLKSALWFLKYKPWINLRILNWYRSLEMYLCTSPHLRLLTYIEQPCRQYETCDIRTLWKRLALVTITIAVNIATSRFEEHAILRDICYYNSSSAIPYELSHRRANIKCNCGILCRFFFSKQIPISQPQLRKPRELECPWSRSQSLQMMFVDEWLYACSSTCSYHGFLRSSSVGMAPSLLHTSMFWVYIGLQSVSQLSFAATLLQVCWSSAGLLRWRN